MNPSSLQPIGLKRLEELLNRDLILTRLPADPWIIPLYSQAQESIYDVVIIGAGMAGMTAGLAILLQGIFNIKIFDARDPGKEGPWPNYARMLTLRSTKEIMGPALYLPNLTFRAWFEAQYGEKAWNELYKIPTAQWMDYLKWYRHVTRLPIENNKTLTLIRPEKDIFTLLFDDKGQTEIIKARKVVLATGRDGFGGIKIPDFVSTIPKEYYAHTIESINFSALRGKKVGIIGAGASAFDAAAVALEQEPQSVDILLRNSHLPNVNKVASLDYPGFTQGFYQLEDEAKIQFILHAIESGAKPPVESLMRVRHYKNFRVHTSTFIQKTEFKNQKIILETNHGRESFDYLILATGFHIDGSKQPELRLIMDHIQLWKDRPLPQSMKDNSKLDLYPYLGSHFEFLEKTKGSAPYLQNLYCFNYAATLSHGWLSSDIPEISQGALRLAKGIAADFFKQDWQKYEEQLKNYQKIGFREEDFAFIE